MNLADEFSLAVCTLTPERVEELQAAGLDAATLNCGMLPIQPYRSGLYEPRDNGDAAVVVPVGYHDGLNWQLEDLVSFFLGQPGRWWLRRGDGVLLSDALCRIATGGGFGTRQLYTNTDEVLFDAKRPIIINGIPTLATRPDLADRSLVLILPTIEKRSREREQAFWGRFEESAGQILGVLLDCIAQGLASEAAVCEFATENEVELPRMADAALWAEAACSCLGWSTGSVLKLFLENQAEVLKHIVDSDPVATAVQDLMVDRADWEGNSTELLAALNAITPDELHRIKEWPRSARSLSEKIRRAAPGIRMVGIGVETRTLEGKTIWMFYKTGYANHATQPTYPTGSVEFTLLNGGHDGHGGQQSPPNLSRSDDYEREERAAIQNEPDADPFYFPPAFDRRGST